MLIPNMMHDVFKKYLGTQEPPHSFLPETLRPSFGKGRNWMKQEMVVPYAWVCVCVWVVCVCVYPPSLSLVLAFVYVKFLSFRVPSA